MEQEQLLMWYFIVGLIYTLYNGLVRKLDTSGDYLLPMVWLLLWPIAFMGLAALGISKLINKN